MIKDLFAEHRGKVALSTAPSQADGPAKLPTHEEMKQVLVAAMPLDEEVLRTLARQRADQVREQLTGKGTLTDERVFLLDIDLNASDHEQIRSRLAIAAAP